MSYTMYLVMVKKQQNQDNQLQQSATTVTQQLAGTEIIVFKDRERKDWFEGIVIYKNTISNITTAGDCMWI